MAAGAQRERLVAERVYHDRPPAVSSLRRLPEHVMMRRLSGLFRSKRVGCRGGGKWINRWGRGGRCSAWTIAKRIGAGRGRSRGIRERCGRASGGRARGRLRLAERLSEGATAIAGQFGGSFFGLPAHEREQLIDGDFLNPERRTVL